MFEIINKDTLHEYEAFVTAHTKGHFLQSYKWAAVKNSWKWEAVAVRDANGKICGALSVLIRKLPVLPYTFMYSARGPVCDINDKPTLTELERGVAALAKKHKAYAFTLDPDVLSSETGFIENMKALGFSHKSGSKDFDGIQPNYVFRLNVKDKTEEDLLAGFHSKTRYNLRLSERKGVTVKLCGKEMLADFSRIMLETGNRDGFITRPQSYFETMMDALGEDCRLYMAFLDGNPIAGTLAIHYGNKVWYLYGASSNEHRNVMPNYLLQWRMIQWALETKSEIYDFRGVSGDISPDNPLYGLYNFKKGFGGDFCEFCGEFTKIYKKSVNFYVNSMLGTMRTVRRKLVLFKNKLFKKA